MRVRSGTLVAVGVGMVAGACSGDDGGGGGEPVSVVGVTETTFVAPLLYELSPDGQRAAFDVDDVICLFDVADVGDEGPDAESALACSDEIEGIPIARWSPDGSKVVAGGDVFRTLASGPVQVVGVDGSTSVVADVVPGSDPDDPIAGAPFFPVFVDDDTVAFGRVGDGTRSFEVVTVDVDSGEERVVGSIPNPEPDESWFPAAGWNVADGALLVSMLDGAGFGEPVSLYSFDLDSGDATEIDSPPDPEEARRVPVWQLHDISDSTALVVSISDLFSFPGDIGYPAWWLVDRSDSAASVGIEVEPSSDTEYVRFAALSPDGATVAALAVDPSESSPPRVATAPVTDVLSGSADWTALELPAEARGAADLGQSARALTWDESGGLVLKSSGAVYRFDTE